MIEDPSKYFQSIRNIEARRQEFIALAKELSESGESFPFPGIKPEAREKMIDAENEFPGYTIPTDTVLDQCRGQGIKIVLGKDPESGNVFIVPMRQREKTEAENRFINPKHLQINEMMDERLRRLALLHKGIMT